jgi:hypothetical protein
MKLVRRVVTRWNSDLAAVRSHNRLKNPVQRFTGQALNKCGAFALSKTQWHLSQQLEYLLAVRTSEPACSLIQTDYSIAFRAADSQILHLRCTAHC